MLLDLPGDVGVASWLRIVDLATLAQSCTTMHATVHATTLGMLPKIRNASLRTLALWRGRERAELATRTIAAGFDHSLALGDDQLIGFGGNLYAQLGSHARSCFVPVRVTIPLQIQIRSVTAGGTHSLMVDSSGAVWGWGRNGHGQLGLPIDEDSVEPTMCEPTLVSLHTTAVSVEAGWRHSMVIDTAGRVFAAGEARHGQLGRGSQHTEPTPKFELLNLPCKVAAAACGRQHSVLVGTDGTVWTCGLGRDGRLGHRDSRSLFEPAVVCGLSGIIAAAAGEAHSVVLDAHGTVWLFGSNSGGQCTGGESGASLKEPTALRLRGVHPNGTVQVSAGLKFTAILSWHGEVVVIGRCHRSKGLYTRSGGGVAAIVAGGQHLVARYVTGEVAACGEGSSGQLGGGAGTQQARATLELARAVSPLVAFDWSHAEQM